MNKADLINNLSKINNVTKTQAALLLESVLVSVSSAIAKGEDVRLLGFGTFTTLKRPARTGRDPRTGNKIKIPAKNVVKFRPGTLLSDLANGKKAKPTQKSESKKTIKKNSSKK